MLGPSSAIEDTRDWGDELEVLLPKTKASSGMTDFLNEVAEIKNLLGTKIGITRESADDE